MDQITCSTTRYENLNMCRQRDPIYLYRWV